MVSFFKRIFKNDMAIDLGTQNTLAYCPNRAVDGGYVMDEPTVLSVNATDKRVLAFGSDAKKMLGSNPGNIMAIRPLRSGVIEDSEIAQKMLNLLFRKLSSSICMMRPRVVVAVSSVANSGSRRILRDSLTNAGAREVRFVEESLAAARGADMPVTDATANMVVDIGGGTSEVSIISLGGIVHSSSCYDAGDAMDQAIITHMEEKHNLLIGEVTAEKIKIAIGSAVPFSEVNSKEPLSEKNMQVCGLKKSVHGNLPGYETICSEEIRDALAPTVDRISKAIHDTLSPCKPELAGDLVNNGMTLTGGGALLPGLDVYLSKRFNMSVNVADRPLRAVIRGLAAYVDYGGIFDMPQAEFGTAARESQYNS